MSEDTRIGHATNDPHTAIPDWVALAPGIGPEARHVIMASMVLTKLGEPPTRRQLALALGVDERSIYRWLKDIAEAGALSIRRVGRHRECVFHQPKPDRAITDRTITDRAISDRTIRYSDSESSAHACQQSHESPTPDRTISDRSVVGVGDHDSSEKRSPTTTNRAPLKTPLARWAKRYGMNAARDIDDPALDYATYKHWIEDHRAMGWEWRQIVSTLREAPLEAQPSEPLADDWIDPDCLVDPDQLVALDSTSRQLARRVERDRQIAMMRGAGLLDEVKK